MKTLKPILDLVGTALAFILVFQGIHVAVHYRDYAHATYLIAMACFVFVSRTEDY